MLDVLPAENIYGHRRRLEWILGRVALGATLVELGCGTGYMLTRPLLHLGYDCYGVDLDRVSIEYGQRVLQEEGLDPNRLLAMDLGQFSISADAVIASEILEHVPGAQIAGLFEVIRGRLKVGGQLLVTVPNGRGWFELESFLWFKAGMGQVMRKLRIAGLIMLLKRWVFNAETDYPHPSTLADSPHVRFFTFKSIQQLLRDQGFELTEVAGSVLFAGPFSDLMFTGIGPVMRLNAALGRSFPRWAAGFYVACRPTVQAQGSASDQFPGGAAARRGP